MLGRRRSCGAAYKEQQMFETFILGAGFSKWFAPEMPLLKELIQLFDDNLIDEINRDKALSEILNKEKNVEKLLSYLAVDYPWKKNEEIYSHRSLYIKIINTIASKLRKIQSNLDYCLSPDESKNNLFEYWYNHTSDIITFNYDNILEKCFSFPRSMTKCDKNLFRCFES